MRSLFHTMFSDSAQHRTFRPALLSLGIAAIGALLHHSTSVAEPISPRSAADCHQLAKFSLADTRIETAEAVTGGSFLPPSGGASIATPVAGLPPFCRVAGIIGKEQHFETWLPFTHWNRKFHGVGIGGFAGAITYTNGRQDSLPGLAEALRKGYAVVATDVGHQVDPNDPYGGQWAIGHPQRMQDYFIEGIHKATVRGKELVRAFYGRKPSYSTFAGCSGGGHQGLIEASYYPDDYDAIVAFAPTDIELAVAFLLRTTIASHRDPAAILRPEQVALTWDKVLKQCDGNDGLVDGSIGDPRRCDFEPAQLMCEEGQTEKCLTPPQVKGLEVYYEPLRDSSGSTYFPSPGENYFAGQAPGNGAYGMLHSGADPMAFMVGFAKLYSQDANWDWRSFDINFIEEMIAKYHKKNSWKADLDAFRKRGGKLILVQGWADWGITPETTIAFYHEVLREELGKSVDGSTGPEASSFVRLFMAPDTDHCGGGLGANQFDALEAVDRWRNTGVAPEKIIASRQSVTSGQVDRTRPLCPYPQEAIYNGDGDINKSTSFTCGVRPSSRQTP